MPAPLLAAAIIRGVAAIGGRAMAGVAARSATTAAVGTAGRAAAGTAASAAAAPAPAGGSVLGSVLNNAKAYTAALRGGAGAQPASPGALSTRAAGKGWSQTMPGPGPIAPVPRGTPISNAARPAPRTGPQAPTRQASRVEDLKTFVKSVFDRKKPRSVEDDVKGMSLDQRYDRLNKGQSPLTASHFQNRMGAALDSKTAAVNAGEKAEQDKRDKAQEERERGAQAGKTMLKSGAMLAGNILALPFALAGIAKGLEQFGTALAESRRPLGRFNGTIANTFARLDQQSLVLQARRAQATGGSTKFMGDSLRSLRGEMAPLAKIGTTAMNFLGTIAIQGARVLTFLVKWNPVFVAIESLAKRYEKWAGPGKEAVAFDVMMKKMAGGEYANKQHSRRPEHDPEDSR